MLGEVAELSRVIAGTEFVPEALRGRPAAVGAAILAGRELGVGPMTALQHLHVIEGRPSMSAQLMRALVLAHGHRIRVIESTSTRCTIEGRRAGEDEPSRVTYTMDDAKTAGLNTRRNWQRMPRQMLVARATGELCRNVFADVIGGMAYTVEEATDAGALDSGEPIAEPAPRRLVARKTAVRKPLQMAHRRPAPAEPDVGPQDDAQTAARAEIGEPALAQDPIRDDLARAVQTNPSATMDPDTTPASRDQQAKIFALLKDLDAVEPRERRIEIVQALIARRVQSSAQITTREASGLIDTLARVHDQRTPEQARQYLDWLVSSGLEHLQLVETGALDDQPDAAALPIGDDSEPGFDDDTPGENS
jgi:hypothetical protein